MPTSNRSRFLLLALWVLLPGIAAAVWAIGHSYSTERQSVERRLSDATRALSSVVEVELARQAAQEPAAAAVAAEANALQKIVNRQMLPPDWVAAVIDPAGTLVARHPGGVLDAGRPGPADLKEQQVRQRSGLFESHSLDGGPVMAYFSTSPQGWTAVTAMPRSQFSALVTGPVQRVAVGALLLLSLAVVGVWWGVRRLVEPMATAEAAPVAVARSQAFPPASQQGRVEALGRLTGGVAHDFNNLLGIISNSAHLIQRQGSAPELQAPVAATLRAVEAGSQLTQHLMRFATRQAAQPQAVALSHALLEWQALLKTVAGKRIEVSIAVAPTTRSVRVDPSELELALTQLTLNARDAMPAGGRLRVQACNATAEDTAGLPPADWVLITVGDDGQADGKAHGDSSAIAPDAGLAQVHEFCVQSGGTSRIASTPGLGTTVSMLLPAC